VVVRKNGELEEVYADLVIAADGTPSTIAKYLNLYRNDDTRLATTFQYQMSMNEKEIDKVIGNSIEIYFGSSWVTGGYTWIFPKRNILAVGNGIWNNFVNKHKLYLKKLLDYFIKNHHVAKEKLRKAKILYSHGDSIGFSKVLKRHYDNGALIIGDAEHFVSYATAEGFYYSMKSEKMATDF